MIWYSPLSWVKSIFGRTVSDMAMEVKADPTYNIMAQFYSPGQPIWSDRNYRAFVAEGYRKCGAVYACCNKIAGGAAGIKWKLYTDESMKREIADHDLLRLWKRPNPRMGSSELIEQIFGFWHLAGNSYLYASRLNPKEGPVELWPLFPDLMKVVAGNNDIQGYVYGYGTANPRIYELDDIMHLKFASYDERSYYGLSPIEVAMRTVDRLNASNDWNMALMQNYGAPSALFTTKGYLTVEQRDQVKKELKKKFQGKRNAGMPLVLEADMDYKQMAIPPKEMDWLQTRGVDERGVCMILDVPSILLSDYEGATYENRKEAKQSLFTENILPKMDRTVSHVNMWLVPMYEDLARMGAYFSYDKKDIEVLAELYTAVEQALTDKATNGWNNGLWDMYAAQEAQDIKPDSNGKGIYKLGPTTLIRSEDLQAYAQACLAKLSTPPPAPLNQLPPPKPNTTVTEVPNEEDGKNPPQNGNNQGKIQGLSPLALPRYERRDGTPQEKGYWQRQTKILDLATKEEKAAYMAQLEKQRGKWEDEIEKRMQTYFNSEQAAFATVLETGMLQSQMENVIEVMLSNREDELKQLIYNIWYDVGSHFSEETAKQLQEAKATLVDIFSSKVIQWLLNLSATKVTQINDTTRTQLRKALADGVQAGESIKEIARRIDDLYLDDIIPNRSRVIASTEVIGASNWASHTAAEGSGLDLNKVWLSTDDTHTRKAHKDADGQKVALNKPFTVGGEKLMYPGDPAGSAKNVIGCRCVPVYERVKADEKVVVLPRNFKSMKHFMEVLA